MQHGSLAIVVAKRDLLSGSFAGPRRICMELVSNGRG